MRKYVIVCDTEEDIDYIVDVLSVPGFSPVEGEPSLLPAIKITNYMSTSKNEVEVELTDEQFESLKQCPRITAISEISDNWYSEPCFRGQTRKLNADYSSTDSSIPESWAMARCSSLSSRAPFNTDFTYFKTGSSVDMIVLDGGVLQGHPELLDSNGNTRLQIVNWSNFAPVTANRSIQVTAFANPAGGDVYFLINNVPRDTAWVVKDRTGTSGGGYPATYRIGVYDFILNPSTANYPFYIGSAVNVPFDSRYVSNNGGSTGTVSLTVWPTNNALASSGQQNTMYYWSNAVAGMGGIIARTDFNTQSTSDLFYADAGGHGSHTTGTAAGSACGWATDSKIYHIKFNFYDSYGYSNNQTGTKQSYDLLTYWHQQKLLNPSLSSRPTVTTNSYGWAASNFIDVDLKVKQLTDNGIHFVHAAGNSNRLCVNPDSSYFSSYRVPSPTYPQGYYTYQSQNPVIEVGALGCLGPSGGYQYTIPADTSLKAEYSNYGDGISIYAPGSWIQSSWNTTSYAAYQGYPDFGLRKISGTSMATPNVAGILATMLDDYPNLTPLQAKQLLLNNAIYGAVSSVAITYLNLYGTNRATGGNPLTLSQYPATVVATKGSSRNVLKFFNRCYNRVDSLSATSSFYAISGFNNGTVFWMNTADNMQFLNSCT
jgi:subtilisin family serine protease